MNLKHYIITMLALLASINVFAEAVEIDGIWYNLITKAKVAEVTRHSYTYTGAVNIPQSVTYNGVSYSVTSIGEEAFSYCSNLTSITIPESVTSIDNSAFAGCSRLTSVNIPGSVTSIGYEAFSDCSGLTSITIPNSVTSIGEAAFLCCSGLTSVTIGNGVTSIGKAWFAYCSNLTSITIPNSVTSIGYRAFAECSGLTSINIPKSVSSIGKNAFEYCSSLTSINIPNVFNIGSEAFLNCSSLTSVTLGYGMAEINSRTFAKCSALTNVYCFSKEFMVNYSDAFEGSYVEYATLHVPSFSLFRYSKKVPWSDFGMIAPIFDERWGEYFSGTYEKADLKRTFAEGWNTICLPFAIDDIEAVFGTGAKVYGFDDFAGGELKFSKVTTLTADTPYVIYVPAEITEMIAFENIVVEGSNTTSSSIDKNGVCFRGTYIPVAPGEWKKNNSTDDIYGLTSDGAIRKEGTEASILGLRAYFDIPAGTEVKGIVFKNGETGIDGPNIEFADANVKALCVANWDTNGDGELSEAEAAAVTSLGEVFRGNTTIKSFNELQYFTGLTSIENFAFSRCSGLTSVTIPNSVTSIGNYAIQYCSGLTSATIPNSVTSIGEGAFNSCSSLTSIVVESGNTKYDSRNNCNAIIETATNTLIAGCQNTIILNSVTSIGNNAFNKCRGLNSVTIPNSVTSIGDYAFYCCESLTSVTIPNSVTSIGSEAFNTCSSLTSVTIGNSVTSIRTWAFYQCRALTSVVSKIQEPFTFGNDAFYDISTNCVLTIPKGTRNAYISAGWTTSVFQGGIVESLPDITFADANVKALCVANWDTNGDGELSEGEAAAVTSLGEVFRNNTGITSFNELKYFTGLTDIGSYAFYNCGSLISIAIPGSVTSIGEYAFNGCSGLTSVHISDIETWCKIAFKEYSSNPLYYAQHLFLNGEEIKNLVIPNSVTSIGDHTFRNCTGLTSVTIPNSLTSIGDYGFFNCKGLTSVHISDLEAWCNIAFKSNPLYYAQHLFLNGVEIKDLVIPNSVTSIGKKSFRNCTGLISVTIPNSVTSIDNEAFEGCIGLTDVWCYAESVPSTGSGAFNNSSIGSATLHVPARFLEAYRTTAPWNEFGTIVPIETKYIINDEIASLNVVVEETECTVEFTHAFNGEWEALYLPFAIDYDAIKADFDLAEIDGIVQNDDDNDGTPDITVLSIIGFKEQMTTPNTPYLIRAKKSGMQTINFENVTIYPTEEATFDCSSFSTRYEFTGSYSTLNASALTERYIVQGGELVKGASSLAPCRWYMTATARKGRLNLPAKIRIMPVEDVITGVSLTSALSKGEGDWYDLSGRKLGSKPAKPGLYIQNGRKVLLK